MGYKFHATADEPGNLLVLPTIYCFANLEKKPLVVGEKFFLGEPFFFLFPLLSQRNFQVFAYI